jgi:hypothetical protein
MDDMVAKVVLEWDWVLFDMVDQETLDMVVFDTCWICKKWMHTCTRSKMNVCALACPHAAALKSDERMNARAAKWMCRRAFNVMCGGKNFSKGALLRHDVMQWNALRSDERSPLTSFVDILKLTFNLQFP